MGLTSIRELLVEETVLPLVKDQHGKLVAELPEDHGVYYKAVIRDPPTDLLVVKLDRFPDTRLFFQSGKGFNSRADYVLISDELNVAVFVELKRSRKENEHIIKQLRGAECLLHYLNQLYQSFVGKERFPTEMQYRFVCLDRLTVDIKPTRDKSPLHDRPESFIRFSGKNTRLKFSNLARINGAA